MLGVLLANTGSPDAPTAPALRRYLAQFLSDRRVIEFPRWLWLPILHAIILNVRPARSARLYRRIWTEAGSPLLVGTRTLAEGLQAELAGLVGGECHVTVGMRYGQPSIAAGLRFLRAQGVETLVVLPLFPQYTAATTATVYDAVFAELHIWRHLPALRLINHYHDHPAYLAAVQASIQRAWKRQGRPERLLFSFHGIPAGYAERGDPYPHHCRRTAERLAEGLGLEPQEWLLSYQSRFGPQEWLTPYTDRTLEALGRAGLRRLGVCCPGFAVDCLETLDEIAHEGCRQFQQAGGGAFEYIPALNASPAHVSALAEFISDRSSF